MITIALKLAFPQQAIAGRSLRHCRGSGRSLWVGLAVALLILATNTVPTQAAGPGTWTPTGSLTTERLNFTATLLPTGQVLAAGGNNGLSAAELYTPSTGTWTPTGSMHDARTGFTATLLPSGQVLVVGGYAIMSLTSVTYASAELYDPSTGSWTPTGSLHTARHDHMAVLLADGRVLVAGGADANGVVLHSAEVYDPSTGSWSSAGALQVARQDASAVLLADGRVLMAGGICNCVPYHAVASAEVYDPSMNSWTLTGTMHVSRSGQTATRLADGTVLVAGGRDTGTGFPGTILTSAEVYNPATGTWNTVGRMASARTLHSATLLPGGQVLVAGGFNSHGTIASAEIYTPATKNWATTGRMAVSRALFGMVLLANGTVLVAGGESNGAPHGVLSGAEIYTPPS